MSQFILTNRDKELLSSLSDFGLMNTSQIQRRMFGQIRKTTVLRRLRKLEKKGLIAKTSGLPKGQLVWSITARGGSLIGLPQGYGHLNRNTVEHDILVSEVRLTLEDLGVSRGWKSGHALKKDVSPGQKGEPVLPDAIILLPSGNKLLAVAIELELITKAKGRYVHVLREYAQKKSIACVWYLVPSQTVMRPILKALQSRNFPERSGDWIYWTLISEIFGDPLQIKLRTRDKTIFLKDLVPIQNSTAHPRAQEMSRRKDFEKKTDSLNVLNEDRNPNSSPSPRESLNP
jgi:DNA-binding HxlR family transcriptional regulator